VSPDATLRALFQLWPVSYSRTERLQVCYEIEWEIPNFLHTCFAESQAIDNILTLTGTSTDAQAASCKEYLDQTWPSISSILLEVCRNRILKTNGGKTIYS